LRQPRLGRCHNAERPKLVAQITETHITTPGKLLMGVVDTASALELAVLALNSLDPLPDLTVLTGDLVESGEVEEYDHLRTLLAGSGKSRPFGRYWGTMGVA